MFNSLLEDVLQPWRAVCCHNVLNITTHQNLLRPSGAFHSLRFIAKQRTLILANNTFYYWTLPHAPSNQIYFLSSMPVPRRMSRYPRGCKKGCSAWCSTRYLLWTRYLRGCFCLCLLCYTVLIFTGETFLHLKYSAYVKAVKLLMFAMPVSLWNWCKCARI